MSASAIFGAGATNPLNGSIAQVDSGLVKGADVLVSTVRLGTGSVNCVFPLGTLTPNSTAVAYPAGGNSVATSSIIASVNYGTATTPTSSITITAYSNATSGGANSAEVGYATLLVFS